MKYILSVCVVLGLAVPDPTSFVIFGVGLAGLTVSSRTRRGR